ncbi:hypothetical protein [Chromobacterium sp. IIBBL 290-4]|uniref:hypothetical protein n=1 Tax=Chromobacterium sp. IIBBL 290-4 TaxID=2953890 RepID=UPI0020B731FC|nr:hypothetical protein [Chromobacterium sp. IIBBL 290-4]UTH72662.1 hypothetical protein NKT35_14050 [Chromobacterium sp. IIBBL 290-4]
MDMAFPLSNVSSQIDRRLLAIAAKTGWSNRTPPTHATAEAAGLKWIKTKQTVICGDDYIGIAHRNILAIRQTIENLSIERERTAIFGGNLPLRRLKTRASSSRKRSFHAARINTRLICFDHPRSAPSIINGDSIAFRNARARMLETLRRAAPCR